MAAVEQAVQKGSSGGYNVLTSELLPSPLQHHPAEPQSQPLRLRPGGHRAERRYPGEYVCQPDPRLRGRAARRSTGQVNQTLTSADNRMGGMVAWTAYQQGAPRLRLLPVPEGPGRGAARSRLREGHARRHPPDLRRPRKDAEDYYGGQATGMSANQYAAYRTSQTTRRSPDLDQTRPTTKRSSSGSARGRTSTTGAIG